MNKSILVVEDTVELLKGLTFFLQMEGFNVLPFTNATDAFNVLIQSPPDLIITDLSMPDMDGFEFIEKIRQQPLVADIPVAIFSARPKTENMSRAVALGVVKYISKPASLDTLLEEIIDIIK